jgi:hypothetical protein
MPNLRLLDFENQAKFFSKNGAFNAAFVARRTPPQRGPSEVAVALGGSGREQSQTAEPTSISLAKNHAKGGSEEENSKAAQNDM